MKWMIYGIVISLSAVISIALFSVPANAQSLRIQPLEYRTTLEGGEKQKGFLDVGNPDDKSVRIAIRVQAFRQIDDNGTLQFFDNELVSAGITPDLQEFELGPKEAIRMYFVVDGAKLPSGDVFAAIFAKAVSESEMGVSPSVQVGTLLFITNGTPGARQAQVTNLNTSWLQLGSSLQGQVHIKNTAPANSSSGFFPTVTLALWPFGPQKTIEGPLIFAGRTRQVSFHEPSDQFGIYKLSVRYGDSYKEKWVVLVTGIWRWVLLTVAGLAVFAVAIVAVRRRLRK